MQFTTLIFYKHFHAYSTRHGNITFGYVKAATVEATFTSSATTIAGGVVHLHHISEKVAVVGGCQFGWHMRPRA